jgi:hypothetical protein
VTAYALDANHDLHLRGGQIARVRGADYVVQSIRTRLLLYQGEWWLDLEAGVPWFDEILGVPGSLRTAEAWIRQTILDTRFVDSLTSFSVTFDPRARRLTITFDALTEFGPSGVQEVTVA